MYIEIPLEPQILALSRTYYNSLYKGTKITDNLLGRKLGDFKSYPSYFDLYNKGKYKNNLFGVSPVMNIGEGSGETIVGFTVDEKNNNTDLTINNHNKNKKNYCHENVCIHTEAGIDENDYSGVTLTKESLIEGRIASVKADYYHLIPYQSYGLFGYLQTINTNSEDEDSYDNVLIIDYFLNN